MEGQAILTTQDVIREAHLAKQRTTTMGANDYEHGAIDLIVGRVRSGLLDAVSAILEIQNIVDSKQDYH